MLGSTSFVAFGAQIRGRAVGFTISCPVCLLFRGRQPPYAGGGLHSGHHLVGKGRFCAWLALGGYFIARKDIALTNRQTLALSTALYFLLPLFEGVVRHNWFGNTYTKGQINILFIDLLFLSLGAISATALLKISKRKEVVKVEVAVQNA
jgi:hypothetical protein